MRPATDTSHRCPCCGQPFPPTGFLIDLDSNRVTRHGRTVKVTRQQAEILFTLNAAMPKVVSTGKLASAVYGAHEGPIDAVNVIKTQISLMRKTVAKLGVAIRPEWGMGYYLQLSEELQP